MHISGSNVKPARDVSEGEKREAMAKKQRELRQQVYIRVCQDSGFTMEPVRAAVLAAQIAECHPLDIWMALDLDLMARIANGTHPASRLRKGAPS